MNNKQINKNAIKKWKINEKVRRGRKKIRIIERRNF